MRIPFDIKFRPQIENGEYKLETECGHPVSIMDWEWIDRDEKKRLAVKVLMDEGFNIGYLFDYDGKRHSIFPSDSDSDLFIVTSEPEPLTKLEKAVFDMLVERTNETTISEQQARKHAPIFLEIVKDEIYSHESLVEYAEKAREAGKAEALKDLPRWKKCQEDDPSACVYNCVAREDSLLYYNGHTLRLIDLEKLPGFKEDSHE